VARVMACLLELKLEFELVRTDAFRRGHKLPELVRMRGTQCCVALFGKERITSTAKSTHEGVGVTPAAHQTHAWAGSRDSPVPWIRYPSGHGLGGW
jgi:hypothetical protein